MMTVMMHSILIITSPTNDCNITVTELQFISVELFLLIFLVCYLTQLT